MKSEPLNDELKAIISENHRESVDCEVCAECSGVCCMQGGSGIFENVLLIYEAYQRGELKRADYEFEAGLTLPAFIARYFDVTFAPSSKGTLVLFFTKVLTSDNELISWKSLSGYSAGDPAVSDKCGSSVGCVFLDGKIEHSPESREGPSRGCILHSDDCTKTLTAKPLQCVLYSCVDQYELKQPDSALSSRWMDCLAAAYPDSVERFNDKMASEISAMESPDLIRSIIEAVALCSLCIW